MALLEFPRRTDRDLNERSLHAVAGRFRKTGLARELVAQYERELVREERGLLREARSLWAGQQREGAWELVRQAIILGGRSAETWEQYGVWLVETERADAALEAITVCLQKEPQRLLALEYFIELRFKRFGNHSGVQQAISRMAAHLDLTDARSTRGALDFVIPYGIAPAIELLRGAADPVTRAVVALNAAAENGDGGDGLREIDLPEGPRRLADVILNVNRGRFAKAASLMADMATEELPEATLRRGLRRALRKPNLSPGLHLVRHLERIRPADAWLRHKRESIEEYQRSTEEYQVTQQMIRAGYPVRPRRPDTAYTPERTRSFYLLHNSLPFAAAGYATRTHGLLRALNARGREITAVTRPGFPFDLPGKELPPEIPALQEIDGVPYARLTTTHEVPRKRPLVPYVSDYVDRLVPLALEHRPSLIHGASNHWNGLAAVEAARQLGVPSVYEVRGLWEVTRASRDSAFAESTDYAFMAQMEVSAAVGADRVIAITAALRDELVARGVDSGKITIVPNGVDTSRFRPRARNVELARSLGLSDKTIIGYVGSLLDYEGLEHLVGAAAELRRERSDFHVLIVGDGAAAEDLRALARRAGVDDVVTFTGRVPHEQVEDYYSIIDIAPLPRQPLPVCEMVSPLKPFEAMAMGKVVVASDVAALDEIIVPGRNGLTFRKGETSALAGVLRDLLDQPEYVRKLGESATEWVRAHRDWEVLSRRVDDIYEELVPVG